MMMGLGTAQQVAVLNAGTATDASAWSGFWDWFAGGTPAPRLPCSAVGDSYYPSPGCAPPNPNGAPSAGVLPVATPAAPQGTDWSNWTPDAMFAATWSNEQSNINGFFQSVPVVGSPNYCPAGQVVQADGSCAAAPFSMPWWGWLALIGGGLFVVLEVGNSPRS